MEFTGKIIAVLPIREGNTKSTGVAWQMQSFVIESHDEYPKKMCFDVFGEDKINQFGIKVGEELKVSFDVDARQWQDRWFNSIRAWKVEKMEAAKPKAKAVPSIKNNDDIPPIFKENNNPIGDPNSDLPF
jgi:hypothetical protein